MTDASHLLRPTLVIIDDPNRHSLLQAQKHFNSGTNFRQETRATVTWEADCQKEYP